MVGGSGEEVVIFNKKTYIPHCRTAALHWKLTGLVFGEAVYI